MLHTSLAVVKFRQRFRFTSKKQSFGILTTSSKALTSYSRMNIIPESTVFSQESYAAATASSRIIIRCEPRTLSKSSASITRNPVLRKSSSFFKISAVERRQESTATLFQTSTGFCFGLGFSIFLHDTSANMPPLPEK